MRIANQFVHRPHNHENIDRRPFVKIANVLPIHGRRDENNQDVYRL
jgi:hypothetical protein